MKNILFITLIAVWSSVAVAEIRFNPLNVARVEGVVGVTHDELRDAISAENQAFSNAVLAVGLNIDTNSVSVLNELAATFGGFPIEGTATTVGGLLVALAAAIAWLKKNKLDKTGGVVDGDIEITGNQGLVVKSSPYYIGFRQYDGSIVFLQSLLDDKADKSDVPYSLVDAAINEGSVTLENRAINKVEVDDSVSSLTFVFPEKVAGKARDFFLRLVITGETVPTLSFVETNGDAVSFDADDDSWAEIEKGVNILMFTDTEE